MKTLIFAFFLLLSCSNAQAQLVTRYALVVGIGEYAEDSGWPRIHGDKDAEHISDELKRHHFLPNNITTLKNDEATRNEILAALYQLYKKVESGDMVYIHFSGHFQQVTDLDGDETDKLDEAFVAYDGIRKSVNNYDGSGHLTDDLLARALGIIQERLTRIGQMVLVFDGGFSNAGIAHKLPVRGTNLPVRISPSSANFRGTQKATSHADELMDYNFEKQQAFTVSINTGKSTNMVAEVLQDGDTLGPLSSAFLHILQRQEPVTSFKNAAALIRAEMKTISPGLTPEIDGALELDFIDKEPTLRKDFSSNPQKSLLTSFSKTGKVYGLCVGVSDYPGENRSLKYAHSDAQSFYNALQSSFGNRMVKDSLFLLLNGKATQSRVFQALDRLKDNASEGDVIYFYFAGHGDVEGSLINKPTFFLLSDGPQQSYSSGGHIPFDLLRNYISTFIFNGVHVYMVVDACHSGNLAGGVQGRVETYTNLRNLDRESVKLLACHPNENSQESERFGGGFGAFTWYLLRGLEGSADVDKNNVLTVDEIGKFLKDSVSGATRNVQNPVAEGPDGMAFLPKPTRFSTIQIANQKKQTEVDEVDSIIRKNEILFYAEIKKQNLIEPKGKSALTYLKKMEAVINREDVDKKPWRADLANAITSKSQQIINLYIAGNEGMSRDTVFRLGVRELSVLLELKTPADPLYMPMLARRYFFEARSLSPLAVDNDIDRAQLSKAIDRLRISLKMESQTAHIHNAMGRLFALNRQYDSAIVHYKIAISFAPRWKFPFNNLGAAAAEMNDNTKTKTWLDSALYYFSIATNLDPKFALALRNKAQVFSKQGKSDLAKQTYQSAILANPKLSEAYSHLGDLYREEQNWDAAFAVLQQGLAFAPFHSDLNQSLGNGYYELGLKSKGSIKDSLMTLAKQSYIMANRAASNYVFAKSGLLNVYYELKNYDSAAYFAKEAMPLDTGLLEYGLYFVEARLKNNRLDDVEKTLLILDRRFPKDDFHQLQWGVYWFRQKDVDKAWIHFNKARNLGTLKNGFEELEDWAGIKKTKGYGVWVKGWK